VGSIGAAGKWQEFCTLSGCLALGHDRSSSDSDGCHSNCIYQANNLRCNHLPCLLEYLACTQDFPSTKGHMSKIKTWKTEKCRPNSPKFSLYYLERSFLDFQNILALSHNSQNEKVNLKHDQAKHLHWS